MTSQFYTLSSHERGDCLPLHADELGSWGGGCAMFLLCSRQ
jgi:hypothetical protein